MICKFCQAELEDGSTVCPLCGKCLEAEPETVVAGVVVEPEVLTEQESLPEETVPKEKTPKTLLIKLTAIISCGAVLLALILGIWSAAGGSIRKNNLYGNAGYEVSDEAAVRKTDAVVATMDGAALTNSLLQMMYWDQVYALIGQYYDYLAYLGLDYTQPLSEQMTSDGKTTWEQYFLKSALETWHRHQALALEAEKANFVLSADTQAFLDQFSKTLQETAVAAGFATADEMVVNEYGPGSTGMLYQEYLTLYYLAGAYFESLYAELEVSTEELEAYFAANAELLQTNYAVTKDSGKLIDVRHILICPEGGVTDEAGNTTYSKKEWEACRKKAQSILDEFLAGEATESAFAALAMEHTEDPGSQASGGLYELVEEGQMVPEFNDWCFDDARQAGDTGLVQSEFGYHIMYYVVGDEGWIRYCTDGVLNEKGGQLLEQILQAYPMEVRYHKIGLGQVKFN